MRKVIILISKLYIYFINLDRKNKNKVMIKLKIEEI
jgi:hypothetical protein